MKTGIFYIFLGFLFLYLAINSIENSIWNARTILLLLIATMDFGIGIRAIRTYLRLRQESNE